MKQPPSWDKDTDLEDVDVPASGEKSGGMRERKREAKVDQILAASVAVFAEEGYSGFSMRKVAVRADVRLNTIQHHFGDLETLLVMTVRTMAHKHLEYFQRIIESSDLPPSERLEIIIEYNLREGLLAANQDYLVESNVAALHNDKIHAVMADAYAQYLTMLAQLIMEINSRSETEAQAISTMIAAWLEGVAFAHRFAPADSSSAASVMVRIKAACLSLASGFRPA